MPVSIKTILLPLMLLAFIASPLRAFAMPTSDVAAVAHECMQPMTVSGEEGRRDAPCCHQTGCEQGQCDMGLCGAAQVPVAFLPGIQRILPLEGTARRLPGNVTSRPIHADPPLIRPPIARRS